LMTACRDKRTQRAQIEGRCEKFGGQGQGGELQVSKRETGNDKGTSPTLSNDKKRRGEEIGWAPKKLMERKKSRE